MVRWIQPGKDLLGSIARQRSALAQTANFSFLGVTATISEPSLMTLWVEPYLGMISLQREGVSGPHGWF